MNFILHVVKIQIGEAEHPFVTTFDSLDLSSRLQDEIKEELIYKLLGVEPPKTNTDDDDQEEMFDTPKRGPGRPRKQ